MSCQILYIYQEAYAILRRDIIIRIVLFVYVSDRHECLMTVMTERRDRICETHTSSELPRIKMRHNHAFLKP